MLSLFFILYFNIFFFFAYNHKETDFCDGGGIRDIFNGISVLDK